MAYQSVVVNSSSDLVAAIKNFAATNGWSISGDVLSKGDTYVKLQATSSTVVSLIGAKNNVFAGEEQSYQSVVRFTVWPSSMICHLIGFSNPDTLFCTMNYDVVNYLHIGFGKVVKYGDWVGGSWIHSSHGYLGLDNALYSLVDGGGNVFYDSIGSPVEALPFWSHQITDRWSGTAANCAGSKIHCEINGYIWMPPFLNGGAPSNDLDTKMVYGPTIFTPIHRSNPNAFNGQTILTPFQLFIKGTDGFFMPIGHLEHIRFVRLTNYNPGDVITIGSTQWKVFPAFAKDTNLPNGRMNSYSDGTISTGLQGIAVKYDGP